MIQLKNNIVFKAYVVFSLYQEELEFDRFFFSCLYRIKINEGSFSYCRLDFSTKNYMCVQLAEYCMYQVVVCEEWLTDPSMKVHRLVQV